MLGKIIGHEYPSSGALGGKAEIMQVFVSSAAAGAEGENVFTASTLAGSNVTCAACIKTIEELERTNALEKASRTADRLVKGLNELFDRMNLPFFAYNYKSIIQLCMSGFYTFKLTRSDALQEVLLRREKGKHYNLMLTLENIITLQALRAYTTLAHAEKEAEIVEKTLVAFENVCKKLTK